jgi:hypothetical protein
MFFNIEKGMDQTCKILYVEGMKLMKPVFLPGKNTSYSRVHQATVLN